MRTRRISFDLEKAKAGAKVVTSESYEVEILSYNSGDEYYPIVGLVHLGDTQFHHLWMANGLSAPTNYNDEINSGRIYDLSLEVEFEEGMRIRRMTNYELAKWIGEWNGHVKQIKTEGTIQSSYWYFSNEEDKEVPENIFIRQDKGEWKEPYIKLTED